MQVSQINSIAEFDRLKTDWEHVYAADPHAHVFLSWLWLRGWFEITPYHWFVLTIRPEDGAPHVAFLPLVMRGPRISGINPIRVLHLGGQPLATYTGFACLPGYEEGALTALAQFIQHQLSWDRFQMEEVVDPRLDFFLERFPCEEFDIRRSYGMPTLYIPLPDNWDQYLQEFMNKESRRGLRKKIRRFERQENLHMTHVQEDSVERDIEILLAFWQWRWGPKPIAKWRRAILHHFFENNCLWLNVLWDGETPIAALGALADPTKRTFYPYIVGHNPEYSAISPGKVVFGYSIRYAIENGFHVYDFLTGLDSYKLSFGPTQRGTANIIVTRKCLRSGVANSVMSIAERTRDSLIKILGNAKRIEIVKRLWFWSQVQIKRLRGRG